MQDQLTLRSGLPAFHGVDGGATATVPLVRGSTSLTAAEATEIAHITTKQDLSRWTRAHAGVSGITWSVFPGEGGTMVIVEHAGLDRAAATGAGVSVPVSVFAGAGAR